MTTNEFPSDLPTANVRVIPTGTPDALDLWAADVAADTLGRVIAGLEDEDASFDPDYAWLDEYTPQPWVSSDNPPF